ncbi:MAG TPA: hypothetical protein VH478_03820 [Trebonia sp.]|jgi:hypothetical protein|nr:hypothetical protein [Trebonia sp.]
MTNYRLFPSASGPSAAASYGGSFQPGLVFGVTDISWFEGYWWWVATTGGQSTSPQKFCLWQMDGSGTAHLISGSVVTSGTLKAGWNWVPLATPIALSVANNTRNSTLSTDGGAVYIASTGFTGPFPITAGQYGAGGAYANGILSGPLLGYSDQTGTAAPPSIGYNLMQGEFGTAYTDPTIAPPNNNSSNSSNFWLDVQVSDTAPSGYSGSYRLFPNIPVVVTNVAAEDTFQQTTGTMFTLSEACTVGKVWFYSSPQLQQPAGLPASTQIWDMNAKDVVAGSQLTASWSGAVGSGWVYNNYASASLTLPAGDYAVAVFNPGGKTFYVENRGYFGTHFQNTMGAAPSGFSNGPLSTPGQDAANTKWGADFGNSLYLFTSTGVPTFPAGWDTNDDGENRWIDIEVTPSGSAPPPPPPPPPAKASGVPLTFFP